MFGTLGSEKRHCYNKVNDCLLHICPLWDSLQWFVIFCECSRCYYKCYITKWSVWFICRKALNKRRFTPSRFTVQLLYNDNSNTLAVLQMMYTKSFNLMWSLYLDLRLKTRHECETAWKAFLQCGPCSGKQRGACSPPAPVAPLWDLLVFSFIPVSCFC